MKKVYVLMLADYDGSEQHIHECSVFSTKSKAEAMLKKMVAEYKQEAFDEYIADDLVGYDTDTDKDYVMIESGDSFSFYKQGNYDSNHLELWILEKIIDEAEGDK